MSEEAHYRCPKCRGPAYQMCLFCNRCDDCCDCEADAANPQKPHWKDGEQEEVDPDKEDIKSFFL